MTRKSTTKKSATDKAEARKRLAAACAEILANPETPTELYNDLADGITQWSEAFCNEKQYDAGYILNCLESHLRAEAKRKGAKDDV